MFHLRVLGPPSLSERSGQTVSPVPLQPRVTALLSLLAMAGHDGLLRERAISILYPEQDETHARHHLSDTLYTIHRQLKNDAVRAEGSLLRLNTGSLICDVTLMLAAVKEGDHALTASLYGGPFLDGFHLKNNPVFDDWLADTRLHLARHYTTAVEHLAEKCDLEGDFSRALHRWEVLRSLDPLNSRYAVANARTLLHSGDSANAIAVLREHCAVLRRELNAEPGGEVTELLVAARQGGGPPVGGLPESGTGSVSSSASAVPEPAPGESESAYPGTRQHPERRPGRARRRVFVAVAATAVTAALAWAISTKTARPPDLARSGVAVLSPFVDSDDPRLHEIAAAVPDLFVAAIPADLKALVVPPLDARRQWQRAGGSLASPLSGDDRTELARSMGAGHVISGRLSGTAAEMTLTTAMTHVGAGGRSHTASATGSADDALEVVRRVAAQLLALEFGLSPRQAARLEQHDPNAVSALLVGLHAARLGGQARRWFDVAAREDSTLLTAVLLGYGAGGGSHRDARWLWDRRARFDPEERAALVPLLGWRFGLTTSVAERLAQFASLDVSDAGAFLWTRAMHEEFHWSRVVGPHTWEQDAVASARHLVLDFPDILAGWERLFALAMWREDTAAASRYATEYVGRSEEHDGSARAWGQRWSIRLRAALLEGDREAADELWSGAIAQPGPLLTAWAESQDGLGTGLHGIIGGLLVDGRGLLQLDTLVGRLRELGAPASVPLVSWARARGREEDWLVLRDRLYAGMPPITAAGLRIRDALFLGAAEDAGVRDAAAFLDAVAGGAINPIPAADDPTPEESGVARARCWSTLWKVMQGDLTDASTTVSFLRTGVSLPYRYVTCAQLIEVALAQREAGDLRAAVLRLDSIARVVPLEVWPYDAGARDLTFGVANLVLSRLLLVVGDTARALDAARRGPWGPVTTDPAPHIWLELLPDYALEESRLHLLMGDTTRSVGPLRRYETLREDASGRFAQERAVVGRELAQLADLPTPNPR